MGSEFWFGSTESGRERHTDLSGLIELTTSVSNSGFRRITSDLTSNSESYFWFPQYGCKTQCSAEWYVAVRNCVSIHIVLPDGDIKLPKQVYRKVFAIRVEIALSYELFKKQKPIFECRLKMHISGGGPNHYLFKHMRLC